MEQSQEGKVTKRGFANSPELALLDTRMLPSSITG